MPPPSAKEILSRAIGTAPAAGSMEQHVQHFLDTLHDHGARIALRFEPRTDPPLMPLDLRDQTNVLAAAMADNSLDDAVVTAKVPAAFGVLGNLQRAGYVIARAPIPSAAPTSFEARRS
jgi:hypothetical protein